MKSNAHCIIRWIFIWQMLLQHSEIVKGQQYNLTKSDSFATLGNPFTFTCSMFLPPNQTIIGVSFYRNGIFNGTIGWISSPSSPSSTCKPISANPRYIWNCAAMHNFTLTIPAENMTEYEQHSKWRCEYYGEGKFRSPDVFLDISIDVYNVSLIPSKDKLVLTEGHTVMLSCTVNSNALPSATITWYLGSTDITSMAAPNTSTISITGNRTDNAKVLRCNATNNSKPPKTVTTILDIKYPPTVFRLSQQNPYERSDLSVECGVEHGNPTATKFFWSKVNDPGFKQNKSILELLDIRRNSTGTYKCTAENMYSNDEKGTDYQTMFINVLYKPEIRQSVQNPLIVEEGNTTNLICAIIAANPNSSIKWKWIKTDSPSTVLHEESTYTISSIQRNRTGLYNCTASNTVGTSEAVTIQIIVQYKPEVRSSTSSPYTLEEGQTATLACSVTDAKPTEIRWRWYKTDSPNTVLYNGSTYTISNIKKERSGSYSCTASNIVGTSKAATIEVDVQYKPFIEEKDVTIVNETNKVVLTRNITSNPLSNVSWFDRTNLLNSETYNTSKTTVTTNLIIPNARCTDTKNLTIIASNKIQRNVTSQVELIVNCKPMPDVNNKTLGVSDEKGFAFSTSVIAYPRPRYVVLFGNSTNYNGIGNTMTVNAINNFTVHINKTNVKQADYGTYQIHVANSFGGSTIYVNVVPQRKPTSPRIGKASCNVNSAKIEWISTFNGGDSQTFLAFGQIGQQEVTRSEDIKDRGENEIHNTELQNLQPSTKYVFYVVATNKHGNSSSDKVECTTLEDAQNTMSLIIGGATAGGMFLAVIVIVVVVLLRRYKTQEKQVGKSQRFNNEEGGNEDIDDDGLKDNILYVSAGPRNDNESEIAEYAAVTKKPLEDNANIYADVKKDGKKAKTEAAIYSDVKPKKGLLKKDGKQKPKKGKKQKGKQVAADVYENSEDIAMTSNADNVYSNTNYNAKNDQEHRGYKNKDGLLYVDVQFDAKKGNENPVIHGEDEKTDYATVEFPMPSNVSAEK